MASCIPFISWAQDLQILGDLRVQEREKCMVSKQNHYLNTVLFYCFG